MFRVFTFFCVPGFLGFGLRLGEKVRFVVPLAPTVTLATLAHFASPTSNPIIPRFGWSSGIVTVSRVEEEGGEVGEVGRLVSERGVECGVWKQHPPYRLLTTCTLCVTTVGRDF